MPTYDPEDIVNDLRRRAAALMAGIGFTMSLFFAGVAFANQPALTLSARVGVLAGSLVSAVLGAIVIVLAARRSRAARQ